MKMFWLGLLVVSMPLFGQRAGGFGMRFGHAPPAAASAGRPVSGGAVMLGPRAGFRSSGLDGQVGLPPLRPIPPLGGEPLGFRRGPFVPNRFELPGFGYSYYPLLWPGYFGGEVYSYAPAPNIIVVQPPPQAAFQPPPAPPPKPANPVIHDYHFSEAAAAPPPPVDQPAYVIALKNGSKDFAVALWVQGQTLHYIDREGNGRRVALSEVDRALTQKLNREQKLPLSLPPAGPDSRSGSKS